MVFLTNSAEQTEQAGETLGAVLQQGDVVGLVGSLGAGKTCFVRGIAAGLGVPEGMIVSSPTFTLVNIYQGRFALNHIDLYRLDSSDDIFDAGIVDEFRPETCSVVEWFDRLDGVDIDHLRVEIVPVHGDPQARQFSVDAYGSVNAARLSDWCRALQRS